MKAAWVSNAPAEGEDVLAGGDEVVARRLEARAKARLARGLVGLQVGGDHRGVVALRSDRQRVVPGQRISRRERAQRLLQRRPRYAEEPQRVVDVGVRRRRRRAIAADVARRIAQRVQPRGVDVLQEQLLLRRGCGHASLRAARRQGKYVESLA
jgi:hypothetical protein